MWLRTQIAFLNVPDINRWEQKLFDRFVRAVWRSGLTSCHCSRERKPRSFTHAVVLFSYRWNFFDATIKSTLVDCSCATHRLYIYIYIIFIRINAAPLAHKWISDEMTNVNTRRASINSTKKALHRANLFLAARAKSGIQYSHYRVAQSSTTKRCFRESRNNKVRGYVIALLDNRQEDGRNDTEETVKIKSSFAVIIILSFSISGPALNLWTATWRTYIFFLFSSSSPFPHVSRGF